MNNKSVFSPVNRAVSPIAQSVLSLLDQSLSFRVNQIPLWDAEIILERIAKYNNIPSNLSGLVSDFKKMIGPMAFPANGSYPNPNNGTFGNLEVSIGNESSLVIYLKSRMYARKMDTPKMHIAVMQTIGQKYRADEINTEVTDHQGNITVNCRLWWD